jgi:hypothetical protein
MVLNQHIRRKKEGEKNRDVKLLTTNRTTVAWWDFSANCPALQRHLSQLLITTFWA